MGIKYLTIIVFTILVIYIFSFIYGRIQSENVFLDFSFFNKKSKLAEFSFIKNLRKLLHKNLNYYLSNKKWFNIFSIIFINNFFLISIFSSILLGIILITPYFVIRVGIKHGILSKKIKIGSQFLLEFGAIIIANSLGFSLGISFIVTIIKNDLSFFSSTIHNILWFYIFVLILLFFAAIIETNKLVNNNSIIPEDIDFDKLKEKAIKNFIYSSSGITSKST